jgi:hypothetical protein
VVMLPNDLSSEASYRADSAKDLSSEVSYTVDDSSTEGEGGMAETNRTRRTG